METHCVPLRNANADIIALLSVTRDITESKNAQALLLASEERYRYLFNNNPAILSSGILMITHSGSESNSR